MVKVVYYISLSLFICFLCILLYHSLKNYKKDKENYGIGQGILIIYFIVLCSILLGYSLVIQVSDDPYIYNVTISEKYTGAHFTPFYGCSNDYVLMFENNEIYKYCPCGTFVNETTYNKYSIGDIYLYNPYEKKRCRFL